MLGDTNRQAGRLICARDTAGHAETGETQKAWDDFMPQVCRGQHGHRRRPETAETDVVWLITQRSEVQILPPLRICSSEVLSENREGLLRVACKPICKRRARSHCLASTRVDCRGLVPACRAANLRFCAKGAEPFPGGSPRGFELSRGRMARQYRDFGPVTGMCKRATKSAAERARQVDG